MVVVLTHTTGPRAFASAVFLPSPWHDLPIAPMASLVVNVLVAFPTYILGHWSAQMLGSSSSASVVCGHPPPRIHAITCCEWTTRSLVEAANWYAHGTQGQPMQHPLDNETANTANLIEHELPHFVFQGLHRIDITSYDVAYNSLFNDDGMPHIRT